MAQNKCSGFYEYMLSLSNIFFLSSDFDILENTGNEDHNKWK